MVNYIEKKKPLQQGELICNDLFKPQNLNIEFLLLSGLWTKCLLSWTF